MNVYKKGIFVALSAVLLVSGCGQTKKVKLDPKNPTTITIWNYYTGAQLDSFNSLIDEFNNTRGSELGIIAETTNEGSISDLQAGVLAAANKEVGAGNMPNIFAAYTDTAYSLVQMGLVADISSYLTDEEKAEYIDSYLADGDLNGDGGIEIFPVAKATEIFMFNQTDWDKFAEATGATLSQLSTIEGVTDTAKQYYEWTDSLTAEPDDGKAFFGRDAIANYMIIGAKQLGCDILSTDKDGNPVIQFPEDVARKLWDNYYVPYINGYFSALGRFRSDDVKTGNAICFVGSSASASYFPDEVILSDTEKYPIEVGVLEAPEFADGEKYAIQQGAGMAVTTGSDAEILASVEFLKWFTENDNNIRFSIASGYLPVKKDANSTKAIEEISEISPDISASLEVSIDTVNDNTMYSMADKDGSIRKILDTDLSDKAAADREQVLQLMSGGKSRTEAVAEYDTDDNFSQWYQNTKTQLEQAVAKFGAESE